MKGIKMKCPRCQFENREGIKFCEECGAKFESKCPVCQASIPLGRKFCGECGHKFNESAFVSHKNLSFNEKLAKIQSYLPKGLTEKILSQKDRIEGEHRNVTVMFCDMAQFTPLVEKIGPEEAYLIMNDVFEILISKVHSYEGTVNELTGDGIIALFGAPIAIEDGPQRAIRSAHAIHYEIDKLNKKLKEKNKNIPKIEMRIGINTGPVVIGSLGNDLRVDFKAVGDTVNLASRVEAFSEPGATNVTQETFKQTVGMFRFEALGKKPFKGQEKAVDVYRVIGTRTPKSRFDVSAELGLTQFIGRQKELELLLDSFERIKLGYGQACSIVSEAGLGKSRLIYEFRKAISNEDITFLIASCVSYGKGLSYHPIVDILKANFNIMEEDNDGTIKEKVLSLLKILGINKLDTLPFILELLSVKNSGITNIILSPEGRKEKIINSLKQLVLYGSKIRPLVLVIEDLHWADKSSEDVLTALLSNIPGVRVLLIFTFRPEFLPLWRSKSYHSQITLNRLSKREGIEMLENLLGSIILGSRQKEIILEKAEGVPLFLEEILKSFVHISSIEKDKILFASFNNRNNIAVPSIIQDVIMARVDTLSEPAKEVIQIGSIVGREFSYDLIKHVLGSDEKELNSILFLLKESELIYEIGQIFNSEFAFKHSLTRDVIYNSILQRKKKELHNRIGLAIEKMYADNIDEYLGILANHYIIGAENYKAAEYSKLTAKKAIMSGSLDEAIFYSEKLVSCLEKLPKTDIVEKKIIDSRTVLGLLYNQTTNFVKSKKSVEIIVNLAKRHDYKKRICQINTILGAYEYAVQENLNIALQQLSESIKAANSSGDLVSLTMANHWIGHLYADNCEFDKSLYHLNKALEISTVARIPWGIAAQKSCIARTVYLYQGLVKLGYSLSCEGFQSAEESGDPLSRAEAFLSLGWAYLEKGQLDDSVNILLKSVELCERFNFAALYSGAECCLGETYYFMGKYEMSKEHKANALRILNDNYFMPSFAYVNELSLVRAMLKCQEKIRNLDILITYPNRNKIKLYDGRIRRHLAEIMLYLDSPNLKEAENWILKAIDSDKQNRLLYEVAHDLSVYGEIYLRKNEVRKANEIIIEAIRVFRDCGADCWATKFEQSLK
jgi:class 3 adenylate cyclase/tetratricopeptide (TPR) repeat protein